MIGLQYNNLKLFGIIFRLHIMINKDKINLLDKQLLEIVNADTDNFKDLCNLVGLDPVKDLIGEDLQGTNLEYLNLEGANLSHADLRKTSFKGTNLRRANLKGANLSGANLQDANLVEADLTDTIMENINLSGAILTN